MGLGSPLQIQHKLRMCLSRGGGHQTLKLTSDASGGVSPFLALRFPSSKIRKLTETISKLLPALKQFQDSGPMQPRLAAAPALLCTQGSCIFNFTVEAFFFYPFSPCYREWSGSMTTNGKLLPAITRRTFGQLRAAC